MTGAIKRQFIIQKKDWIWMLILIFGAGIFGIALFGVIALLDAETVSYFPLGTLMAMIAALLYEMIMPMANLGNTFDVEVSMGCTRKQFFISYCVINIVSMLLCVACIMCLNLGERFLYRQIYVHMEEEIDLFPYLLRWGLPAAVVIPVLAGFCGSLMQKFGRTAFWILWAIWMVCCLGLPHLEEASENSVLGQIRIRLMQCAEAVSMQVWILLILFLAAAAFTGTWLLLRKAQVNR